MTLACILFGICFLGAILGTIYLITKYGKISIKHFYLVGIVVYSCYAFSALFLGMAAIKNNPDKGTGYDIGLILIDNFIGSVLFGLIIFGFSTAYQKISESKDGKIVRNEDVDESTKSNCFLFKYGNSLSSSVTIKWRNLKSIIIKNPIKFILLVFLFTQFKFISSIFNQIESVLKDKNGIFYDSNGNFEWVGITSLIAILSLLANSFYNQRKFKADLVSRSRIEWIQIVRLSIADLITSLNFLSQKERNVYKNKVYEEVAKIFNNINLLKLYLGPDSGNEKDILNSETNIGKNEEIIKFLDGIYVKVQQIESSAIDDGDSTSVSLESLHYDGFEDDVQKLANVFRIYLKLEWDKAKKGK